jgi:hypothetical protein
MQCIERISGGLQLRPAGGEMGEQDLSLFAAAGVTDDPVGFGGAMADEQVVCSVLDMA